MLSLLQVNALFNCQHLLNKHIIFPVLGKQDNTGNNNFHLIDCNSFAFGSELSLTRPTTLQKRQTLGLLWKPQVCLPARVPREAAPIALEEEKNYSTSFSSTSSSVRLTGVHFSSTKEDGVKPPHTPTYSQVSLSTFLSNNGGCQFVTNLGRSSLR